MSIQAAKYETQQARKTLDVSRNIVSFFFSIVFSLREQLVAQQKHWLRVEEICCEK